MQRPPDRKAPQILFTRGTTEWIARVAHKHKRLTDIGLSVDQKNALERWSEIEFVYSTLALEGQNVSREQVSRAASSNTAGSPDASPITNVLSSYRTIATVARSQRANIYLTPELLLKIHHRAEFRTGVGGPRSVDAKQLPLVIENALGWYTAESFAELNPVEQSALVLLRLLDIQPFADENERTALAAASLFTLRSDLPSIILKPELQPRYRNALDEASRMNTQPMVETIASAIEASLDAMFEIVGKK